MAKRKKEAKKTPSRSKSKQEVTPTVQNAPALEIKPSPAVSSVSDGVTCAVLSYIAIGIIWYAVDEKIRLNEFAKFHVKQALSWIVLAFAMYVIGLVIALIPSIGEWILWIVNVIVFIIWLFGIVFAATGQKKELPIIGEFAKYFTF